MNSNTDVPLYSTVYLGKKRRTKGGQRHCTVSKLETQASPAASGSRFSIQDERKEGFGYTAGGHTGFNHFHRKQSASEFLSPLHSKADLNKQLKMQKSQIDKDTKLDSDSSSFFDEEAYAVPLALMYNSTKSGISSNEQRTERQSKTGIPLYSVVDLSKKRNRRKAGDHTDILSSDEYFMSPLDIKVNGNQDYHPHVDGSQNIESLLSTTSHTPVSAKSETVDSINKSPSCPERNGNSSSIADMETASSHDGGQGNTLKQNWDYIMSDNLLFVLMIVSSLLTFLMCVCTVVLMYEVTRIKPVLAMALNVSNSCPTALHSKCLSSINFMNSSYKHQLIYNESTQELRWYTNGIPLLNRSCVFFNSSINSLSGYYWLSSANGSLVNVYCDMNLTCGNVYGGWTRLVKWDRAENGKKSLCDLPYCNCESNRNGSATLLVQFPLLNVYKYTKVCGKIKVNFTERCNDSNGSGNGHSNITAVSFTYGMHYRNHIWTLVTDDMYKNLCDDMTLEQLQSLHNNFFLNCSSMNITASVYPWSNDSYNQTFFQEFSTETSDPIEMWLFGDVIIDSMELFVQ